MEIQSVTHMRHVDWDLSRNWNCLPFHFTFSRAPLRIHDKWEEKKSVEFHLQSTGIFMMPKKSRGHVQLTADEEKEEVLRQVFAM